jgi:hypothetical protein
VKQDRPSTPNPLVRKVLAGIRKARGGRLVDLNAYHRAQIDPSALQQTIVTDEASAGMAVATGRNLDFTPSLRAAVLDPGWLPKSTRKPGRSAANTLFL